MKAGGRGGQYLCSGCALQFSAGLPYLSRTNRLLLLLLTSCCLDAVTGGGGALLIAAAGGIYYVAKSRRNARARVAPSPNNDPSRLRGAVLQNQQQIALQQQQIMLQQQRLMQAPKRNAVARFEKPNAWDSDSQRSPSRSPAALDRRKGKKAPRGSQVVGRNLVPEVSEWMAAAPRNSAQEESWWLAKQQQQQVTAGLRLFCGSDLLGCTDIKSFY